MTAHKHAEMIKAKADNMDLVVFGRMRKSNHDWIEMPFSRLVKNFDNEYFLCLPQNKEACLHWLNGGEVLIKRRTFDDNGDELPFEGFLSWSRPSSGWIPNVSFMNCNCTFKVRPKKEKRWIAVDVETRKTSKIYPSKSECDNAMFSGCASNAQGWQFIEIEIEVQQ